VPPSKTSDDVELLRSMGYAQELLRRMSGFSSFAISFSIICIVAGGITSLHLGVSAVGGAAAGIVWPIGVGFSLIVALCMAQVRENLGRMGRPNGAAADDVLRQVRVELGLRVA